MHAPGGMLTDDEIEELRENMRSALAPLKPAVKSLPVSFPTPQPKRGHPGLATCGCIEDTVLLANNQTSQRYRKAQGASNDHSITRTYYS
jgi:hypothetical protein